MKTEEAGLATLVRALNDVSRTKIGNPWKGSYAVSIFAIDRDEVDMLLQELHERGIEAQLNSRNGRNFIALYRVEAIRALLDLAGHELDETRRTAVDALVRARGPVPPDIVRAIRRKRDLERSSFSAIAHLMNRMGIVDGMGGRGWDQRKVRAAYKGLRS
jgi:hypothetical protein